jgi:ABC-type glycerol-3-phosphate transport system substrate-binding protein
MALAGAFLDLNTFIGQDADFNLDDYVRGVIDGGLFNGKRYLMPYAYYLPVYAASTKVVNDIGFDMSKTSDMLSFISEISRTFSQAQSNPNFQTMLWPGGMLSEIRAFSGVPIADFETGTALPDEENLRKLLEAYKPYFPVDDNFDNVVRNIGTPKPDHLINGTVTFLDTQLLWGFFETAARLKQLEVDFEMFTVPGVDGKVYAEGINTVAIRAGSPNQQNAWNFIKLLLSAESQKGTYAVVWKPVNKEALVWEVERWYNYFSGSVQDRPGAEFILYAKLSEAEKQAYLNLLLNVDDSNAYHSGGLAFDTHMIPFLEGDVSYETAINGLRNHLTLYVSE